jgi:hypothetical protein
MTVTPTAALIPKPGQERLVYVPASHTDIRVLFARIQAQGKALS